MARLSWRRRATRLAQSSQSSSKSVNERTSGIDVQASYGFTLGRHTINLDYTATILDQLELLPFRTAETLECAGFFGNGC